MTKATKSDLAKLEKGLDEITKNQKTRKSVVDQFERDISQGVSYVKAARKGLAKAASTITTGNAKLKVAYKAAQAKPVKTKKPAPAASPKKKSTPAKKKPSTHSWATRAGTFMSTNWTFRKFAGSAVGVLIGIVFVWGTDKVLGTTNGFFNGINVIILILAFIGGVALGLYLLNRSEQPKE